MLKKIKKRFQGEEFGHETVSRVVATEKNIEEFQVGERGYPYPLFAKDDTSRAGTIGGFLEYILVPNAKRNHSFYSVDDRIACLTEPFTIGFRAARRARPKAGESFAVFGCGTIGLSSAISLRWFGAEKVMLYDVSQFRLNIAKELGFETYCMSEGQFLEKAESYFGPAWSLHGKTANIDGFIDAVSAEEIYTLFPEKYHRLRWLYAGRHERRYGDDEKREMGPEPNHHPRVFTG